MTIRRGRIFGLGLLAVTFLASAVRVWWVHHYHTSEAAGVIRLAHTYLQPGVRDAFAAVIAEYERRVPGVRIEQIAIPERHYASWAQTNLSGGVAPDLMEMGPPGNLVLTTDLLARFFLPLSQELEKPNPYNEGTPLAGVPWRNTFVDGLDGQSYNADLGEYFGVANTVFTTRVFYNEELYGRATGRQRPPADFREFITACEEIRAYGRRQNAAIFPVAGSRAHARPLIIHLFTSQTQRLLLDFDRRRELFIRSSQAADFLSGRWTLDQPEVRSGLELVRQVGQFMQPGFLLQGGEDAGFLFSQQRAVFIIAGSWDSGSLRAQSPFPIGAFRMPLPNREDPEFGRYVLGPTQEGGVAYLNFALLRASPHRDRVIDFLRFLTSYEGNRLFTRVSRWMPAVREVPLAPEVEAFAPVIGGFPRGLMIDFLRSDVTRVLTQNYHLLFGATGGVDAFIDRLRADYAAAVRRDAGATVRDMRESLLTQDAVLGALRVLSEQEAVRAERLSQAQERSFFLESEYQLLRYKLSRAAP